MNGTNRDEHYMARCIQLARNGQQNAAPNPMVGAVIVCDGAIIGEGYHVRCGEGHAEVNAVRSLRRTARKALQKMQTEPVTEKAIEEWISEHCARSTIYVSLEPCAHFGKTPPCADLLASLHFRRCVIGCTDLFAQVAGRGIQKLRDAGIAVTVGVLEEECKNLNKAFFTYHALQRPYILLKWAETADGYTDRIRHSADEAPLLISTPHSLLRVHKLRSECQAILVGRRTAELDRPSLTVKYWYGHQPLRIILDREGRMASLPEYRGNQPCPLLFIQDKRLGFKNRRQTNGSECLALDFSTDILPSLLSELFHRGIQSLLVEGGTQLTENFLRQELWDEIQVEHSPVPLDSPGIKAPSLPEGYPLTSRVVAGRTIMQVTTKRY